MKLYIASHSRDDAKRIARVFSEFGHTITSSWINEDFSRTSTYTDEEKRAIADKDVSEVLKSGALILLSSPHRVAGGKFVEAGVAIGAGIPVYVIGHRENMLLWHSSTVFYQYADECAAALSYHKLL